jgi:hypothetical protein
MRRQYAPGRGQTLAVGPLEGLVAQLDGADFASLKSSVERRAKLTPLAG